MAFQIVPGPHDGDPARRANAELVSHIAFLLEADEQMWESAGEAQQDHERRIARLEGTVAVLEALVIGETPGGAR